MPETDFQLVAEHIVPLVCGACGEGHFRADPIQDWIWLCDRCPWSITSNDILPNLEPGESLVIWNDLLATRTQEG